MHLQSQRDKTSDSTTKSTALNRCSFFTSTQNKNVTTRKYTWVDSIISLLPYFPPRAYTPRRLRHYSEGRMGQKGRGKIHMRAWHPPPPCVYARLTSKRLAGIIHECQRRKTRCWSSVYGSTSAMRIHRYTQASVGEKNTVYSRAYFVGIRVVPCNWTTWMGKSNSLCVFSYGCGLWKYVGKAFGESMSAWVNDR